MKRFICLKSLLFAMLFFEGNTCAYGLVRTAVAGGGDWNAAATWDGNSIPTHEDDVVIPSGVTVTISADTACCKSLVVQGTLTGTGSYPLLISGDLTVSGSLTLSYNTLACNATILPGGIIQVSATGKKLMLGTNGAESTFTNNGTIGSSTRGLYLEIYKLCPKLTLTGTPSVIPCFHSIRPDDISGSYVTGLTQEIVIDQNIIVLNTIGLVNSNSASKNSTRTLTLTKGKTITLGASAYFHSSYTTDGLINSSTFKAREAWIYTINGVLDATATNAKINLQTNLNTSSYTDKNTLTLHVGSTGMVKCGGWIGIREGQPTNRITVDVAPGGTIVYSGTSYTKNRNAVASTSLAVTNSFLTETNENLVFTNPGDISLTGELTVAGNYSQASNVSGNRIRLTGTALQTIEGGEKAIDSLEIDNTSTEGVRIGTSKSLSVNTLILQPGVRLTNPQGGTFHAKNALFYGDALKGTATFTDQGTSIISTACVQLYLTKGRNWYISSPVSLAEKNAITGATGNSLISYRETDGTWPEADNQLDVMKGYIATSPIVSGLVPFCGVLNTGSQTVTLSRTPGVEKSGFNLTGNPYPSYVNGSTAVNNSGSLDKSIWYRTKNEAGNYVFDVINTYSGVGSNNNGSGEVSELIPPMQAVWVRVAREKSSAVLTFDNSMRSHELSTNRLKVNDTCESQPRMLRLQVSNGINSDETLVMFHENASDGFDEYDSPKMTNANPDIPEIYTTTGTEYLAINTLNRFNDPKELALGFTTGMAGNFTIRANGVNNFDQNTRIVLKDYLAGKEQEISNESVYNFSSDVTGTVSRFGILFTSVNNYTSFKDDINDSETMNVSVNASGQIILLTNENNSWKGTVTICNVMGQKLYTFRINGSKTLITPMLPKGLYFIVLNTVKETMTRKMLFK